jgi:hypothetical protein
MKPSTLFRCSIAAVPLRLKNLSKPITETHKKKYGTISAPSDDCTPRLQSTYQTQHQWILCATNLHLRSDVEGAATKTSATTPVATKSRK